MTHPLAAPAVISQFFILSPRGEKIIARDYRFDIPQTSDEPFFRQYKSWEGSTSLDAPPVFVIEGVSYAFIKRGPLLFVVSTRRNGSPAFCFEVLQRIASLIKDYLGNLTEMAIRRNAILVYEILDEAIEFGYVQELSTEKLRALLFHDPIRVESERPKTIDSVMKKLRQSGIGSITKPSSHATRSVMGSGKGKGLKNEVFIDVLEKLTVAFDAAGTVVTCEASGAIVVKSFLIGSPELRLGLSEDFAVGRGASGSVVVDDCNFHACVNLSDFESERVLLFTPPDGECSILNYRATGQNVDLPFRIFTEISEDSSTRVEVLVRIRADMPDIVFATDAEVMFVVPKSTCNVNVEFGVNAVGHSYEYDHEKQVVRWKIKKFLGRTEHICRAHVVLSAPMTPAARREFGPLNINFEVPAHSTTGLRIRFLKIDDRRGGTEPARWVRHITRSTAYSSRM